MRLFRNNEPKDAAAALIFINTDAPAMGFYNRFANSQTKSGSFPFAFGACAYLSEFFENSLACIFWNARSMVGYAKHSMIRGGIVAGAIAS